MREPFRRSPLHGRSGIGDPAGAAKLAERPFLGKFVLRADPAQAADAVRQATGLELPVQPCTSARSGDVALLWVGPDEWWLVTGPAAPGKPVIATDLDQGLSGIHHQIVDVSDYYTAIELAGPRAREMLMKLTTLDLHPRAFGEGRVAGSMFARTQATLWLREEAPSGPVFLLFVRWSMADYLWCLLAEAGREFGIPEQIPRGGETWRLAR